MAITFVDFFSRSYFSDVTLVDIAVWLRTRCITADVASAICSKAQHCSPAAMSLPHFHFRFRLQLLPVWRHRDIVTSSSQYYFRRRRRRQDTSRRAKPSVLSRPPSSLPATLLMAFRRAPLRSRACLSQLAHISRLTSKIETAN